jgi:hypothetical protein
MTEMSLKELLGNGVSELIIKYERLCQAIADKEDKDARLDAAISAKTAELERVTAALKERRQQHQEVEASFVSLANSKDSIRRQADAAWKEMQAIKANAAWKEIQAIRVS